MRAIGIPAVVQARPVQTRWSLGLGGLTPTYAADLIDTLHIAVAPNELGDGERLWERPEELTDRFHLEQIPSHSRVVHHYFWRR